MAYDKGLAEQVRDIEVHRSLNCPSKMLFIGLFKLFLYICLGCVKLFYALGFFMHPFALDIF